MSAQRVTLLASRPRRVLVVDDHQDSAEVAALQLELRGHTVRMASCMQQALQLAIAHRPEVAIVDVWLGGDSGYALARRLRLLPGLDGLRLVAATGLMDRYTDAGAEAQGVRFARVLTKPISEAALFAAVEDEARG